MASGGVLCKIPRLKSIISNDNMYFHKNRMYSVNNKNCSPKKCIKAQHMEKTTTDRDSVNWGKKINKSCQSKWDAGKKKKRSKLWNALFGEEKKKLPVCKEDSQEDPDLSMFGGQPYGTCGDAYVIKIENVSYDTSDEFDKETQILKKIEAPYHLKNTIDAPMPTFYSAEQRLLDLADRGLHPCHDKLRVCKKKPEPFPKLESPEYKFYSGPMKKEEIPVQIKFNKDLLEAKHMFAEFKRVEPPQQILSRLIEIKKNERKYDEKPKVFFRDEKPCPNRNVFDSVFQHPLL